MTLNTFANEKDLPLLPVPLISSTAQQLLSALKPIISSEEYEDLLLESADFVANGYVNLIQKHLEAISKNPKYTCYLNAINDETNPGIYGTLKGGILPRNPYLILEEDPYSKTINPPNQSQRAAKIVNSALKFVVSLRNETLKPDLTPKRGNPLTMNCYKNLFGTTRIPDTVEDKYHYVSIKKFQDINDSRHIIIICNNQYYSLEVLTEFSEANYDNKTKHKIWYNDYELSNIFQEIIDSSGKVDTISSTRNSIGAITSQTFNNWKQARQELAKTNKEFLELIDNSLFVLVLDSLNSPQTDQEKTEVISHGSTELLEGTNIQVGSCTSRWYDKLQFIITKNSVAGVVWESTSMDSTAILRFISDIYTDLILKLAKNINGSEYTLFDSNVTFISADGSIEKPKKLKLNFHQSPELQNIIHCSETRLTDIIGQHEYKTLSLKIDNPLLKNLDISMDSFLQMCFQITIYTLYGKMANTLEPITTRKFKDARTELISIQNDMIFKLAKMFITKSNPQKKWETFKQCCDNHLKQYHDAMSGKGFERHFITLLHIISRPKTIDYLNMLNPDLDPIPNILESADIYIPLLSNPNMEKILAPEMLISNCGNNALHLFGIPPAIDQGFGIGYIIHNDKVVITICTKYRQTQRFADTFLQIVTEMRSVMQQQSNFFIDINDSEARKLELKRLRIEKELKHIDHRFPLTRHPIQLKIDVDSNQNQKSNGVEINLKEDNSTTDSKKRSDGYDILGGYGYFDFGLLELRSDAISRTESFMNSHSNVHSSYGSHHQSSTNLHKILQNPSDIRQKLNLSESIREKLSRSNEDLSTTDTPQNPESSTGKQKAKIGRQLNIPKFV